MAGPELINCSLFTTHIEGQDLTETLAAFLEIEENRQQKDTFVILYSPSKCFLGRLENDSIIASSGKEPSPTKLSRDDLKKVFEARVFNQVAELRWLNGTSSPQVSAILSEKQLEFAGKTLEAEPDVVGGLKQQYLIWGKVVGPSTTGWTTFGTSRIGSFLVPIATSESYARFEALEYLKTYEDGNVAVVDERLTGIEVYKEIDDG